MHVCKSNDALLSWWAVVLMHEKAVVLSAAPLKRWKFGELGHSTWYQNEKRQREINPLPFVAKLIPSIRLANR